LKSITARLLLFFVFSASLALQAQHTIKINATLDRESNTITVAQEITYFNQSNDTIGDVVLNDWINAYSDKNSYLGKRFSDEFVRSFHFAPARELGGTRVSSIVDDKNRELKWTRPKDHIDLLEIGLTDKILPYEKRVININYQVKIPSDRFTKYGYDSSGNFVLRDWFLVPARYDNHKFIRYSNADTDDIPNSICDYELSFIAPSNYRLVSDLNEIKNDKVNDSTSYQFTGKLRNNFSLYLTEKPGFYTYKNDQVEVVTDINANDLTDIQKALIIDRIVTYVHEHTGIYPFEKITVSSVDYERNPYYGLNQLPSFINVFQDEFVYELKFLKTYLNNYLKNSLHLDSRKENWIYDAIQVYLMMKYIEENRPEMKMLGGLSRLRLLQSYHIIDLDFNEQYSFFYLMMARRNLDQSLSDSKDALIRFNEKIANKYRAGLSLNYLDQYLTEDIVPKTISSFYSATSGKGGSANDFKTLLQQNTSKNIDWFFDSVIGTRDLIDYTFKNVAKTKDSITFTIVNKTGATVPIPVYGLKNKTVVYKKWFENIRRDSTFTIAKQDIDKIVLNYKNEVPEHNRRNNWNSLHSVFGNNRPFKFVLFKDLEDPDSNQIIFVPSLTYNLYDGISPGIRFNNKTLLAKPFIYDINPIYSPNTGSLRGISSFSYNQFNRNDRLFFVRYGLSSSYFNYAPDASFFRINPNITLNFRDENIRKNDRESFIFRYNVVEKQESKIVLDNKLENYSIFNFKYINSKQELANFFNLSTDSQLSNSFGKISGEINYRRLFKNNRQFNFRLFAGSFLFNKNSSDTFDFGVSKINDYLFETDLLGRSETSGIYSQQFIMGDAGFKSKVLPESVNQWLVATNISFNVWNWIEVYGDLGVVKSSNSREKFIHDNGIRFNLVPDYFELYFPVYSNNGWEIAQDNYGEKIRIVFTIDPKLLINLFTRKWF
jgi:hypothetical protein